MSSSKIIHVAAAVIERNGEVLLGKRPEHVHQGGLWEFPGGKVEPGEKVAAALIRELEEELGIRAERYRPLIRVTHHYSDKSVLLDVYRVLEFSGEPKGLEGQKLSWVLLDQLDQYPMPAADKPIVNAIRLPETCLITGEGAQDNSSFMARLEQAVRRNYPLIQLRAPNLADSEYRSLAVGAVKLCRANRRTLLLNCAPELVVEVGADGVHLSAKRLMAFESRPLSDGYWVGASCHSFEELQQAERIGADFVLLSPVMPTQSHPEAKPMGWERFQQLCDQVSVPVYALGGVGKADVVTSQLHGAQGVAGISAFW